MPRKKTLEIPVDSAIPPSPIAAAPISCPACKSKISSDGKTLHEKSSYLEELVETDTAIDEVEKKLEKQQKTIAGHEATIADLRAQLGNTVKQIDAAIDEKNKKPAQEKETTNVGTQGAKPRSGKPSWWD